jgi:hypothetical protein
MIRRHVVIGLRRLRKQPAPPRLEHAAKHPLRGLFSALLAVAGFQVLL